MSSSVAVAMKLLGVDPQELKLVQEALAEASIDAETHQWGPHYELATQRLNTARAIMDRLVRQL